MNTKTCLHLRQMHSAKSRLPSRRGANLSLINLISIMVSLLQLPPHQCLIWLLATSLLPALLLHLEEQALLFRTMYTPPIMTVAAVLTTAILCHVKRQSITFWPRKVMVTIVLWASKVLPCLLCHLRLLVQQFLQLKHKRIMNFNQLQPNFNDSMLMRCFFQQPLCLNNNSIIISNTIALLILCNSSSLFHITLHQKEGLLLLRSCIHHHYQLITRLPQPQQTLLPRFNLRLIL